MSVVENKSDVPEKYWALICHNHNRVLMFLDGLLQKIAIHTGIYLGFQRFFLVRWNVTYEKADGTKGEFINIIGHSYFGCLPSRAKFSHRHSVGQCLESIKNYATNVINISPELVLEIDKKSYDTINKLNACKVPLAKAIRILYADLSGRV